VRGVATNYIWWSMELNIFWISRGRNGPVLSFLVNSSSCFIFVNYSDNNFCIKVLNLCSDGGWRLILIWTYEWVKWTMFHMSLLIYYCFLKACLVVWSVGRLITRFVARTFELLLSYFKPRFIKG
jgi:hypothetical protein